MKKNLLPSSDHLIYFAPYFFFLDRPTHLSCRLGSVRLPRQIKLTFRCPLGLLFSPWFFVQPNSFFLFLFLAAIPPPPPHPPFSFWWECIQNKAKLIMKSQASAGWLACGWAPATCSLMPECSAAQPRKLAACPPVRTHPAAPLRVACKGCKNLQGRHGRASLCGCGVYAAGTG